MKCNFLKVAILLWIALLTTTGTAMAQPELSNSYDLIAVDELENEQLAEPIRTIIGDITEGGRLDTDFNTKWLAEWWYLNGKVRLVSMEDNERKDLGFFVAVGHQESAQWLAPYSHLFHFYALYFDDDTPPIISYSEAYVPRETVEDHIGLRTPHVDFQYDFYGDTAIMHGSGLGEYRVTYIPHDSDLSIRVFFRPNVIKTIDQADCPLPFNTYERAYGSLRGTISLGGKTYRIVKSKSEGYFDHMMPRSPNEVWTREFHGWNWFEVTTESYQAVLYAIRSLDDGYSKYSYKKLTILDKATGKVLAEYLGDDVQIDEGTLTCWEEDEYYKRPAWVKISTTDGKKIEVKPAIENVFDKRSYHPYLGNFGFVDFMGYDPDGSRIQYEADVEYGNSFCEYLITVPPPI
jgi:hypothetical protein